MHDVDKRSENNYAQYDYLYPDKPKVRRENYDYIDTYPAEIEYVVDQGLIDSDSMKSLVKSSTSTELIRATSSLTQSPTAVTSTEKNKS